jgi:hypothetical protein
MDVAIANYVHSRILDFNTGENPKFMRILELPRRLAPTYKPPSVYKIWGQLLTHWMMSIGIRRLGLSSRNSSSAYD